MSFFSNIYCQTAIEFETLYRDILKVLNKRLRDQNGRFFSGSSNLKFIDDSVSYMIMIDMNERDGTHQFNRIMDSYKSYCTNLILSYSDGDTKLIVESMINEFIGQECEIYSINYKAVANIESEYGFSLCMS